MRRLLITLLLGFFCTVAGLCVGIWFGPQLKLTQPGRLIVSLAYKVPWTKSIVPPDDNSPIEMYDYPTIKWRPKPLADPPGAIAQLWTTYEWADQQHQSGKMNYRLTVFKAPDKRQCQVQLLDEMGFKITQFEVSEFHQIPGAADIMEARESHSCTEDEYKRVGDYSIN